MTQVKTNNETVQLWLDELFKSYNDNITKDIITGELTEVAGTISNERIWIKGSEEPKYHESNLEDLLEYQDILIDMLNALEN